MAFLYHWDAPETGPGEYFVIQPDTGPDSLLQTEFNDEGYQTTSGMEVHFSQHLQESQSTKQITSAIVITPDGSRLMVTSSLSRQQIKALLEDLVQPKGKICCNLLQQIQADSQIQLIRMGLSNMNWTAPTFPPCRSTWWALYITGMPEEVYNETPTTRVRRRSKPFAIAPDGIRLDEINGISDL